MLEQVTQEECKDQLEALGITYKKHGITLTKLITDGEVELKGRIFNISLVERVGYGVQVKAEGNEKSCVISYESMVNIAEAMGLFDNKE